MTGPRIEFPSRMETYSPTTDQQIDALRVAFNSLSKMLQASFNETTDTLQALRVLPEMITALRQQLSRDIATLTASQFDSLVQIRNAAILTLRRQREAIEQSCDSVRDVLAMDLARVSERAVRLGEDASRSARRDIERLDDHAFSLLRDVYAKQVEDRWQFLALPTMAMLTAHATDSMEARRDALAAAVEKMTEAASTLTKECMNAWRSLDDLCTDVAPGCYEVVDWSATVRDAGTDETQSSDSEEMSGRGGELAYLSERDAERLCQALTERGVPDDVLRRFRGQLGSHIRESAA